MFSWPLVRLSKYGEKGFMKVATRRGTCLIKGVVAQFCFFLVDYPSVSELTLKFLHSSVISLLDESAIYAYRSETCCEETASLQQQLVSGVAHRGYQR